MAKVKIINTSEDQIEWARDMAARHGKCLVIRRGESGKMKLASCYGIKMQKEQ